MRNLLLNAILLGTTLASVGLLCRNSQLNSKADIFDRIPLGLTESDVKWELYRAGVYCGTHPATPQRKECIFQDSWREYYLDFGPDNTLTRKYYLFKSNGQKLSDRPYPDSHAIGK